MHTKLLIKSNTFHNLLSNNMLFALYSEATQKKTHQTQLYSVAPFGSIDCWFREPFYLIFFSFIGTTLSSSVFVYSTYTNNITRQHIHRHFIVFFFPLRMTAAFNRECCWLSTPIYRLEEWKLLLSKRWKYYRGVKSWFS